MKSMQKLYVEVHIPVSSYILKFLRKKYGDKHYLSKRSHIGRILIQHIKKTETFKYFSKTEQQHTFTVLIPESYIKKYGYELDDEGVRFFNDILEIFFDENLIDFVSIQLETGRCKYAKKAIEEFLDYYDITPEERSFNTAYMTYKRSVDFKIKPKRKKVK